jgi:hypothetical protein
MPTKFSNQDLVCYALYLLGGEVEKIHIEDIAVKCHKDIDQASFSLIKYSQYPAIDTVRYALEGASKESSGALVTREKHGKDKYWCFTDAGRNWISVNLERLSIIEANSDEKTHRSKSARYLSGIRTHPLFQKYLDKPSDFKPTLVELAELFNCLSDTTPKIWESRFDKLRIHMNVSNKEEEFNDFLYLCTDAYQHQK